MTGLTKNQRVIVRLPGNKRAWGVFRGYEGERCKVLLDLAAEEQLFKRTQVKAAGPKPTAKLELPKVDVAAKPARQCPIDVLFESSLRSVVKPDLPEECPAWLAMVRKMPCCNCGSRQNIEAHHEGKKGLSQKVRDTMAVPLCSTCHRVYTDKNALPDPAALRGICTRFLRSREESLDILRTEQERLLDLVLARLELTDRIELLSHGLAKVRGIAQLLGRVEAA